MYSPNNYYTLRLSFSEPYLQKFPETLKGVITKEGHQNKEQRTNAFKNHSSNALLQIFMSITNLNKIFTRSFSLLKIQ